MTDSRYAGVKVICKNKAYYEEAKHLAEHLGSEYAEDTAVVNKGELFLCYEKTGLTLSDGKLSMCGDFSDMVPRVKDQMWQHELLARAAKPREEKEKLTAIDATAGMGEDSLILAASGYHVKMIEYDPVIASLLKDTLRRARKIPELKDIVGRMELLEGDSIEVMTKALDVPDLIYLDPMFPGRQKSGSIKKKFQLLQKLERPCGNEKELLNAALSLGAERILIKRPAKGPYLAGRKPDYSLTGGATRFDCIRGDMI